MSLAAHSRSSSGPYTGRAGGRDFASFADSIVRKLPYPFVVVTRLDVPGRPWSSTASLSESSLTPPNMARLERRRAARTFARSQTAAIVEISAGTHARRVGRLYGSGFFFSCLVFFSPSTARR